MEKSNYEERTHTSTSPASPPINFEIKYNLSEAFMDLFEFCQECAYHCVRKSLKPYGCENFVCCCSEKPTR